MDCDDLPGRLRDICNGTARKSNGENFTEQERDEVLSRRSRSKNISPSLKTVSPGGTSSTGGCGRCGKKK